MPPLTINASRFATRKAGVIGMEFSRDALRLVQLRSGTNNAVELEASASLDYKEEQAAYLYQADKLRAFLNPIFKREGFRGKRVATVMPSNEINILSLNYQVNPGTSEEAAMLEALQDRFDGNLMDYVVDMIPVRRREADKSATALIALAEKRKVVDYLECLRKAGFCVDTLEIGPSAIQRLVAAIHSPVAGETVLAINFGSEHSYVSILSGRRLLFDEELDFGEGPLLGELSQTLKLDWTTVRHQLETLGLVSDQISKVGEVDVARTMKQIVQPYFIEFAESVKQALLYAVAESRGAPVSRIYILGSLARWNGIDRILEELLGISVEVIPDPLAICQQPDDGENAVEQRAPELAVATGLALKGMAIHE